MMHEGNALRKEKPKSHLLLEKEMRKTLELGRLLLKQLLTMEKEFGSEVVKAACVSQFARLHNHHQSILLLCKEGCSDDAKILARTMIESYLVMLFLLCPRIELYKNKKELNDKLDRNFRAKLFFANQIIQEDKMFQKWTNDSSLKQKAQEDLTHLEEDLSQCEKMLGQEWVNCLKKSSKHLFGLGVSELAERLGQKKMYEGIYRKLSQTSHSVDADTLLRVDLDRKKVTPI